MDQQTQEKNDHEKVYTIIVNGREKTTEQKELTFVELVILAFGTFSENQNTTYTITYNKGGNEHKPEGTIIFGESVKIKNGTIFNVTATDKS